MGWVVNPTTQPLFPRERATVPIVYEAGWAPGPVRTGAENLSPLGFDSRTGQARRELLYQLSYLEFATLILMVVWRPQAAARIFRIS
jgi:hypothetical protein